MRVDAVDVRGREQRARRPRRRVGDVVGARQRAAARTTARASIVCGASSLGWEHPASAKTRTTAIQRPNHVPTSASQTGRAARLYCVEAAASERHSRAWTLLLHGPISHRHVAEESTPPREHVTMSGIPLQGGVRPQRTWRSASGATTMQAWRPRPLSVHARRPRDDVPGQAVDDAHVRGLRDARRHERALQAAPRARADRALDGVRHADADGLRPRSRAQPRRGRARGRLGRLASRTPSGCSTGSRSIRSRRR